MSENIIPRDGEAFFYANFFPENLAQAWLTQLTDQLQWRQQPIKLFGRQVLQPRLVAWYGDEGCSYKYSGIKLEPLPWQPILRTIKVEVENFCQTQFNSALANLYRNQKDSMGAHRDNEKELGAEPVIASVSLGATRKFLFHHIATKQKVKLELPSGSLLVMKGQCQNHWKHELPKLRRPCGPRINVTFRHICI